MEKIADLKTTEPEGVRHMCIVDHSLYITDGNGLYKMDIPVETLWQKIGKFLGFIK